MCEKQDLFKTCFWVLGFGTFIAFALGRGTHLRKRTIALCHYLVVNHLGQIQCVHLVTVLLGVGIVVKNCSPIKQESKV